MSETVNMALSEVRSLVTKAARGAGMNWGMAEEAGWAADWLARRAMPAAEWATLWLAKVLEGRPNAVEVGVGLADRMAAEGGNFAAVQLPDDLFRPGLCPAFRSSGRDPIRDAGNHLHGWSSGSGWSRRRGDVRTRLVKLRRRLVGGLGEGYAPEAVDSSGCGCGLP